MRKHGFLISLLLLPLLLFTNCNNNTNRSINTISIDTPIDWGVSMAEDTIKMTTVLRNLGSRDILIDFFAIPCACITVEAESNVIKQNDSTLIHIRFRPQAGEAGFIVNNIFVHFKNIQEPGHFAISGRIRRR